MLRTAVKLLLVDFVGANSRQFSFSTVRFAGGSLLVAEHASGKLSPSIFNAVTAATQLKGEVTCLVVGQKCKDVADQLAKVGGVGKVLFAEGDHLKGSLAEPVCDILVKLQQANNYSNILAVGSAFGRAIIPRLGAKLDVQPVSDVIKIKDGPTFVRLIYAGNAVKTLKSKEKIQLLTVRPTAFEPAKAGSSAATVEELKTDKVPTSTQWLSTELSRSDRPELASARVVIGGGRGLKNGENFKILYELADKLGGAVGATRAAVDAGFVPNQMQVGQTGKIIAPELYIAVGISGAIQHVAGIKDSKVIVAINKDPEAPIFQISDFGLVEDLFTAVPAMTKLVGNK